MKAGPTAVKRVAVVGLGTIGMSWAAYLLARGVGVLASDPDPSAFRRSARFVELAWAQLEQLGLTIDGADPAAIEYRPSATEAVQDAEFVLENGPENIRLKQDLLSQLDAAAPSDLVIASSTSAFTPSALQQKCAHPERIIIAHPFNPPHLVPLVELCGGEQTDAKCVEWAHAFFKHLRRMPIILRQEIYGHVANRLQYVIYNEAVRLVLSGVVSVQDLETAVTYGPGLRWPFMGPFLTHHVAGGPSGMRGAFQKFEERDRQSTDRAARIVLSEDQKAILVEAMEKITGGKTTAELEVERDAGLSGLLVLLQGLGRV